MVYLPRPSANNRPTPRLTLAGRSKRGAVPLSTGHHGVRTSLPEGGPPQTKRCNAYGDPGPAPPHRDKGRASGRRRGPSGDRSSRGSSSRPAAWGPFAAAASAMAASRRAVPARSRCTQTDPPLCCCSSYPPAVNASVDGIVNTNGTRTWYLQVEPLRPSAPPLPASAATQAGASSDLSLLRLADAPPDVCLVVGPENGATRSFPVHASVLRSSPVLQERLERGTGAEDCGGGPGADGRPQGGAAVERNAVTARDPMRTLRVVWDNPNVFEKMLLFLYNRDVRLDCVPTALELLRLSQAFVVPGLFSVCLRHVGDQVDLHSALAVLTRLCEVSGGGGDGGSGGGSAIVDSQQNLLNETRARCLEVVDRHAERLLADVAFERLPHALVALVLARDSLWLRSELSAAEGADRWATAECLRRGQIATASSKRVALGDAVYLVRHFRLGRDNFRRGPALLGDDEAALVLDFMDGKICEAQLTPNLRANLALRERLSLPPPTLALPPSSPPAECELRAAPGQLRSQTMARTRKSTSAKMRKCAADILWTVVSILD